jgi:hypothetical protein
MTETDANKALVVRYFESRGTSTDYDIVDELAVEQDPAEFKKWARGLNEAFTGAHVHRRLLVLALGQLYDA